METQPALRQQPQDKKEAWLAHLSELEEQAQRMGVHKHSLIKLYLYKLSRRYDQRIYAKLVKFLYGQELFSSLLARGELPLIEGLSVGGKPLPGECRVHIALEEITQGGALVIGKPGSGKSVFAILLLASLIRLGKDFWVFDPKGLTYRVLGKFNDNVIVVPYSKLRFNLLAPPAGVSTSRWSRCLSFQIAELGLIQGIGFLQQLFNRIYKEVEKPNMGHLLTYLRKASPKEYTAKASWIETVQGIIARIVAGVGKCLDSEDNSMLEQLTQPGTSVIFETRGLYDLSGFLVSHLLMRLYEQHLETGKVGGIFRRLCLLEEAQINAIRERGNHPATGSAPFLIQMVTTGQREAGLPLVALAQNFSQVSLEFRNNVFFTATFRSGADDISAMKHLGSYRGQVPHLQRQDVILTLRDRVTVPIRGRSFDAPSEFLGMINDDQLATIMASRWQRLEGLWRPIPTEAEMTTKPAETVASEEKKVKAEAQKPPLSAEEMHFLTTYAAKPMVMLTELYQRLKPVIKSKPTAIKIQQKLVAKEMFYPPLEIECRGRGQPKILALTELGYQLVESIYGKKRLQKQPRGQFLHAFYIAKLVQMLTAQQPQAKVVSADTRLLKAGGEVDVTLQDETGIYAFEVALSVGNITAEHLQKRLDAGYARVTVLCEMAHVEMLKRRLGGLEKVEVVALKSFLELAPKK